MNTPILAIIVPCYNEFEVLEDTTDQLLRITDSLIAKKLIDPDSYILFVDDGSSDNTWQLIKDLSINQGSIKGLKLSTNFGHQNALLAGMEYIGQSTDCVITIDADLQDDTNVIEDMIIEYQNGSKIVYGVRNERKKDSFFKRNTAKLFYQLMKFLNANVIFNHADFRLVSREVISVLKEYKEVNLFLRGIFPSIGFKYSVVYYERSKRLKGQTKYPLRKMISFAWEGITSFSVKPLELCTRVGFIVFFVTIIMGVYSLYSYLFLNTTIPGWTSITLPLYLLGGIQLIFLGVIGEYLGKTYKESKGRPRYIIEEFQD